MASEFTMQYPEKYYVININKQFNDCDFYKALKSFLHTNNSDYIIKIGFDHYTTSETDCTIHLLNQFFASVKADNTNRISVCIDFEDKSFLQKDWEEIDKINTYVRSRNSNLMFDENGGLFTFYEARNAWYKFECMAQSIPTSGLSPLEKLLAYYINVIKLQYNNKDPNPFNSRTFCGIFNNDCIVCIGYSKLMENLCKYSCDKNLKCIKNFCKSGVNYHCNNYVYIRDKKYDIEGIYELDATQDSNKNTLNFFMSTIKNAQSRKNPCISSFLTSSDVGYYTNEELFDILKAFLPDENNKTLNKEHKDFLNFFIDKTTSTYKEECQSILKSNINLDKKNTLLDKLKSKYVDFNKIFAKADFKTKLGYYRNKLNDIAMNSPEITYDNLTKALEKVIITQHREQDFNKKYYDLLMASIDLASQPDNVGYHNCFYNQHKLNQNILNNMNINFKNNENNDEN